MASPLSHLSHRASCPSPRGRAAIVLVAILLSGCSINLGSLTPSSSEPEPAKLTSQSNIASLSEAIKSNPNDPQAYNKRGAGGGRGGPGAGSRGGPR